MKNVSFKLLLFFGAVTLIFACTKEEEKKAASIIGSWFASEYHYKEYTNDTLTFRDDSVFKTNDEGVLKIDNSTIISTYKQVENDSTFYSSDTATYTINGNVLIIINKYKIPNGETVLDTDKFNFTLSETELKLNDERVYTQNNNTYKDIMEYYFKRK